MNLIVKYSDVMSKRYTRIRTECEAQFRQKLELSPVHLFLSTRPWMCSQPPGRDRVVRDASA